MSCTGIKATFQRSHHNSFMPRCAVMIMKQVSFLVEMTYCVDSEAKSSEDKAVDCQGRNPNSRGQRYSNLLNLIRF